MTAALRNSSRQEKTSLFTILAAALNTLIFRYTGTQDIPLGIPLADRDQQDLQSVIGFLLHTHVLRTQLSGAMTFRDLLSKVQKAVLDLYMHRAIPFHLVVQKLHPERNLGYAPLFQVMLNWRDRDQQFEFIGLDGVAVESLMAHAGTSKFDLLLFATDVDEEIWLELEYSSDLFDEDRCKRLLQHYQSVLEKISADSNVYLDEIPLLSASEREQLVETFNDTGATFSRDGSVQELFEHQARRTPEAVALEFEKQELKYGELNRRANQLAHYLRKAGVRPDERVAICAERGFEMAVAVLAVLKAGGAYVPLDPGYPIERLTFMVEDSAPVVLLTEGQLKGLFASLEGRIPILDLKTAVPAWSSEPETDLDPKSIGLESRHLAYLIFTSGSTGKPKGVEISHSALVNFLYSMQREPGFQASDTLLAVTTLCFDIAGLELYLPLITGGRVVIASREDAHDPARLMRLMGESACTVMQATPATWRALIQGGWSGTPGLKALCGGEALTRELADALLLRCAELWNMYGPTETTIWSTLHKVTEGSGTIPIGRPIANTQVYVLDRERMLVPIGVTGELYIGGDGLARGYWHRDELTGERFVENPFAAGARMYRTGDLARWLADGTLECLGRVDNQVKLRGFRVELGEIEALLSKHPAVRKAAVIAREDIPNDKRLVAYYTTAMGADAGQTIVGAEQFRTYLAASLPEYMVPTAYVHLNSLPLTPNGKLDRKALPIPENKADVRSGYKAPENEVEERIVSIWRDVLNIVEVGRDDNFFDLGGHSLLVIRVQAQLRQAFHKEISIVDMFRYVTVRTLAQHLSGRSNGNSTEEDMSPGKTRREALRRHRQLRQAILEK